MPHISPHRVYITSLSGFWCITWPAPKSFGVLLDQHPNQGRLSQKLYTDTSARIQTPHRSLPPPSVASSSQSVCWSSQSLYWYHYWCSLVSRSNSLWRTACLIGLVVCKFHTNSSLKYMYFVHRRDVIALTMGKNRSRCFNYCTLNFQLHYF